MLMKWLFMPELKNRVKNKYLYYESDQPKISFNENIFVAFHWKFL